MANVGNYQAEFNRFRVMLESAETDTAKLETFTQCARRAAEIVAGNGLAKPDAVDELVELASVYLLDIPSSDIQQTIAYAFENAKANGNAAPAEPPEPLPAISEAPVAITAELSWRAASFNPSDDNITRAFILSTRSDDFVFNMKRKEWFYWDGICWRDTGTLPLHSALKPFLREINVRKDRERAKLMSASKLRNIEFYLRSELMIEDDAFDRFSYLFNTPSYTIDLRGATPVIRAHDRNDFITKVAAVDPGGDCPLWRDFVLYICKGRQDLADYLQRLGGYAIAGDNIEQIFSFLIGSGSNGKTTFMNTLQNVFGDYSITMPGDLFIEGGQNRHKEILARMRGRRYVVISEMPQDAKFNSTLLKQITGGERISANFMRENTFEFIVKALVMIGANDVPHLRSVEDATIRRTHLIPFDARFVDEANGRDRLRDRYFEQKLVPEWPGILQWCIEGFPQWRSLGLARPDAVRIATREYVTEEDTMQDWFEQCAWWTGWASTGDLYNFNDNKANPAYDQMWVAYCERSGTRPGSKVSFARKLTKFGERTGLCRKSDRNIQRGFEKTKGDTSSVTEIDLPF